MVGELMPRFTAVGPDIFCIFVNTLASATASATARQEGIGESRLSTYWTSHLLNFGVDDV